jgi:single-strand DNA-binding protein
MLKVILTGNLGRDPEMRYTPAGIPVCNISVASNRKWKDSEGNLHKETTWTRCTVWRQQAENANQYLKKGSKVYIEGRLTVDPETGGPRVYTRQDGTSGAAYEIQVDYIEYLDSPDNGQRAPEEPPTNNMMEPPF